MKCLFPASQLIDGQIRKIKHLVTEPLLNCCMEELEKRFHKIFYLGERSFLLYSSNFCACKYLIIPVFLISSKFLLE